jgi:hypothetical protein
MIKATLFCLILILSLSCSNNESSTQIGSQVKKIILASKRSTNGIFVFPEFGIDWEQICLLRPYQDDIPQKYEIASRANLYLRTIEFNGDESHIALLFINDTDIKIARIKRSDELDSRTHGSKEINGYRQVICSNKKDARFYLAKDNETNKQIFDLLENK